jgi:hypothetical protein
MCTETQVQAIVDRSEERTNARLDKFAQDNAKVISNFMGDFGQKLDALGGKFDTHVRETVLSADDIKAIREILDGYQAASTIKKMVIGLAGFVLAVGAIIGTFIGIIKAIK